MDDLKSSYALPDAVSVIKINVSKIGMKS